MEGPSSQRQRLLTLFRAGRWFGRLEPAFQARLLELGTQRLLSRGERLFSQGDPPGGLFGVIEGALCISTSRPSGDELLLALLEAPVWFGEISLLDAQPRTHDVVAAQPTKLLQVPEAPLQAWLAQHPAAWRAVGALAAGRLRWAYAIMEEVGQPLRQRLARRLVLSAERYGEWQGQSSRQVGLRQEQLASMLATSRQSVNRLLKELEAAGLVKLSYRAVELVDLAGLRRLADPRGRQEGRTSDSRRR